MLNVLSHLIPTVPMVAGHAVEWQSWNLNPDVPRSIRPTLLSARAGLGSNAPQCVINRGHILAECARFLTALSNVIGKSY